MTTNESPSFTVDAADDGDGILINVASNGERRGYRLNGAESQHFFAFFRELHRDFGTRLPHFFAERSQFLDTPQHWQPLLTENVSPTILAGYGDPAVLKTDGGYYLLATSNDAPDAFPILHSEDLVHWKHKAFVFPEGKHPEWTVAGRRVGDFWAPEMAEVGDEYWVVYTARQKSNVLAIGLARSKSPLGPFVDNGRPWLPPTQPSSRKLLPRRAKGAQTRRGEIAFAAWSAVLRSQGAGRSMHHRLHPRRGHPSPKLPPSTPGA